MKFFPKISANLLKILIFVLFFGLTSKNTSASIKKLLESSYVPLNTAVGGSSTNLLAPSGSSFSNPALLGGLSHRGGTGIGYVNIGLVDLLWAQVFIPSPVGTVSFNGGFFDDKVNPASADTLDQYYFLSAGYAKQFTSRFSFGIFLKPAFGSVDGSISFFSLAIEPSFMYNTRTNVSTTSGLGLYDLSFYLLSHNLGVNILNPNHVGPSISIHLGTQFLFYNKYDVKLAINGEIIGVGNYSSLPARLGLGIQYRFLNISGGYAFGTQNEVLSGFTIGGGFIFSEEKISFAMNYAFARTGANIESDLHTVFLNFNINYTDNSPPDVHVKTRITSFSPNWDGEKDYVDFEIEVKDASLIKDWKFLILDKQKRVVRKFASDTRDFEKEFGVKEFFVYLFKKQAYLSVPSHIRWDGTADPVALEKIDIDSGGSLSDGIYSYEFSAVDEFGNKSKGVRGFLKIDRQAPAIQVKTLSSIFSPNGDGILEDITVLHEADAFVDDDWQASFINSEGEKVKSYQWGGRDIPVSLVWDGKDDLGNPMPEGLYTYVVKGSDLSGNQSEVQTQPISLVRKVDIIDVKLSSLGISPNNDKFLDDLVITPVVLNQKDIKKWRLTISQELPDENTKEVSNPLMEWSGKVNVLNEIRWVGKSTEGRILEDGIYYIQLGVEYASGNHPISLPKKIFIDTKKPEVNVNVNLAIFSPDRDGKDDEIVFTLSIEDESPIKSYELLINEVSLNNQAKEDTILFKKFTGKEKYSEKKYWNGKSDNGSLVESATEYQYYLTATDIYGNQAKSKTGKFETDILVLVTERGLKIRISNLEFALGKATLKPKTKDLIKKIHRLLERYSKYNVKVEGHTDDLGEENFNLVLSKNRAKTVTDYLIELGIDAGRLNYQGLGEVSPIRPNINGYNRGKNRRVEFFLKKK